MKRNIVVSILLSLVTCGIYEIYWWIKLNDEVNRLSNHPNDTSGGIAFLLTVVTCGIYGWYWNYKMGSKCDELGTQRGDSTQYFPILFLVLGILGFEIVNLCLMQDTINKALNQAQ